MKRLKGWQKNLIFAAVVLAAAALLFVLYRANAPKAEPLVAVVDFGDGITETIPLDEDHDYLYDVGDYIVHLQVKDGAIAFLDSQCPDHVCEQFGWLSEQDAWAACVPASPPFPVSRISSFMLRPILRIASITSSGGILLKIPAIVISAEVMAFTAPMTLRFTHGTSTSPATGSHASPSRFLSASAAALAISSAPPPRRYVTPPAAIAEAEPISA